MKTILYIIIAFALMPYALYGCAMVIVAIAVALGGR